MKKTFLKLFATISLLALYHNTCFADEIDPDFDDYFENLIYSNGRAVKLFSSYEVLYMLLIEAVIFIIIIIAIILLMKTKKEKK